MRAHMDVNDRLAVIDGSAGLVGTWDKPPVAEIGAF